MKCYTNNFFGKNLKNLTNKHCFSRNHRGTEVFLARQNAVPEDPDVVPERATSHRTLGFPENVIGNVFSQQRKRFFTTAHDLQRDLRKNGIWPSPGRSLGPFLSRKKKGAVPERAKIHFSLGLFAKLIENVFLHNICTTHPNHTPS